MTDSDPITHHSEEDNNKDKSITIKIDKTRFWQFISGILTLVLLLSIATSGFGLRSDSGSEGSAAIPNRAAPAPVIDVSEDDDSVKGSEDATVTIIEFSDFQCPFCRRFFTQTLPQLEKEYIETGKVKLIYRDLPLNFHPTSQKAAEAAECAGDQNKFWEMHDKIFNEQSKLGSGTVQFTVTDLKSWAKEIDLDTDEFNACLDSNKYQQEVQNDAADAAAAGATGTPTFFINGQRIVGAQPFSVFQQIIDAELSK